MKIYVVTSGCYSDYHIEKVFTDKTKATEYAEWLEDSNDIEEYETEDELQVNKFYNVVITLKVYDNGRENLNTRFSKTDNNGEWNNYISYSDYHKYSRDHIDIFLKRQVPEVNWNEDFYIDKYTKATYDILAQVKHFISEGYTESQINELLNNR